MESNDETTSFGGAQGLHRGSCQPCQRHIRQNLSNPDLFEGGGDVEGEVGLIAQSLVDGETRHEIFIRLSTYVAACGLRVVREGRESKLGLLSVWSMRPQGMEDRTYMEESVIHVDSVEEDVALLGPIPRTTGNDVQQSLLPTPCRIQNK